MQLIISADKNKCNGLITNVFSLKYSQAKLLCNIKKYIYIKVDKYHTNAAFKYIPWAWEHLHGKSDNAGTTLDTWYTRVDYEKRPVSVLSQAPSAVDFITYFAVVTLIYDHQEHRGHSLPLVWVPWWI